MSSSKDSGTSKSGGNKPEKDDIQGSKGQSGPERTQSDTMNSSPRQSPPAGKTGDKPVSPKSGRSGSGTSSLH